MGPIYTGPPGFTTVFLAVLAFKMTSANFASSMTSVAARIGPEDSLWGAPPAGPSVPQRGSPRWTGQAQDAHGGPLQDMKCAKARILSPFSGPSREHWHCGQNHWRVEIILISRRAVTDLLHVPLSVILTSSEFTALFSILFGTFVGRGFPHLGPATQIKIFVRSGYGTKFVKSEEWFCIEDFKIQSILTKEGLAKCFFCCYCFLMKTLGS